MSKLQVMSDYHMVRQTCNNTAAMTATAYIYKYDAS